MGSALAGSKCRHGDELPCNGPSSASLPSAYAKSSSFSCSKDLRGIDATVSSSTNSAVLLALVSRRKAEIKGAYSLDYEIQIPRSSRMRLDTPFCLHLMIFQTVLAHTVFFHIACQAFLLLILLTHRVHWSNISHLALCSSNMDYHYKLYRNFNLLILTNTYSFVHSSEAVYGIRYNLTLTLV